MILSNFHTHCSYCDGKGDIEDFVKEAISRGFAAIGFSCHSPLYFCPWTMKEEMVSEYLNTLNTLKNDYRGVIEIYSGLEIDYIPGQSGPGSEKFKMLNMDYNIGSVHGFKNKDGSFLTVDADAEEFEEILMKLFDGSMERFCRNYYSLIREMVKVHNPDIVGHLDLIKKNNREDKYFSEDSKWYREEVLKTLEVIAGSDSIVEVNTGGMSRNYIDTFYPSPWILHECRRLEIPVTISSDAHNPGNIDAYFEDAALALREAGYTSQRTLLSKKWTDVEI